MIKKFTKRSNLVALILTGAIILMIAPLAASTIGKIGKSKPITIGALIVGVGVAYRLTKRY